MVFAHHPVDDPDVLDASQLGDRDEVALVEKLLSDFRAKSNKGVSMVGSHAQIADVAPHRGRAVHGAAVSGKDPYGTPDRGGFTGWLDWHVDAGDRRPAVADGGRPRVRAVGHDRRAGAARARATRSSSGGSIVQPSGVATGTRVVPLRYPMSVHWSGSDSLAIGTDVDAARAAGKVAILDPATRG